MNAGLLENPSNNVSPSLLRHVVCKCTFRKKCILAMLFKEHVLMLEIKDK